MKRTKFFITLVTIAFFVFLAIGSSENENNSEDSSKTSTLTPNQYCKDAQGRPRESACRTALRSKGYNVDKYVKWGGADNGENAAVCTATDANGTLYGFEVVFGKSCEAVSVKIVDY